MRHPSIPEPSPDLTVWRYMPFHHFEDLVLNKEIHLTRLDQFPDKHEGHIPMGSPTSPQPGDIASQRHAWAWRFITFASCWHIARQENSLMWPNYGTSSEGVVIKSTSGKLAEIASFQPNSFIAEVNYEPWPDLMPKGGHWQLGIRKRREFEGEAELRIIREDVDLAILDNFPQLGEQPPAHWPHFHKASFDGFSLIDEVRVHPKAPTGFRDRVEAILASVGLVAPVLESSLAASPIWFQPPP